MSLMVRVVFIALCAYAGSEVAGGQFPGLPDYNQTERQF